MLKHVLLVVTVVSAIGVGKAIDVQNSAMGLLCMLAFAVSWPVYLFISITEKR